MRVPERAFHEESHHMVVYPRKSQCLIALTGFCFLAMQRAVLPLFVILPLFGFINAAQGETSFSNLYSFTFDGYDPENLVAANSLLYGMKSGAGGTIYSLNPKNSAYHTVYTLKYSDGTPALGSEVIIDSTLYGITSSGGANNKGSVFSLNLDGSGFHTIHSFNGTDGLSQKGNLIYSGTTLYGTTVSGGAYGYGVIFSMNLDGSDFQVLHSFSNSDGKFPNGGLTVVGSKIYGTSQYGGDHNDGSLFSLNLDGSDFQTLHSFNSLDGISPIGGLAIVGTAIYGTTSAGGSYLDGTIYSINLDGSGFRTLHLFNGSDGEHPFAGLTYLDSTLYGTTLGEDGPNKFGTGYGTVFSVNTDGSNFQTLHSFRATDGYSPIGGLMASGSTLFGITELGGAHGGGTVFSISVPEVGCFWLSGVLAISLAGLLLRRFSLPNRDKNG